MAIRLRARHMVPGEVTVRARPIFDNHGLAEHLLEFIRYLPGKSVGRTTWHECHDQAHRAHRIGLCAREPTENQERGSTRCHLEELTAPKFHRMPPGLGRGRLQCGPRQEGTPLLPLWHRPLPAPRDSV